MFEIAGVSWRSCTGSLRPPATNCQLNVPVRTWSRIRRRHETWRNRVFVKSRGLSSRGAYKKKTNLRKNWPSFQAAAGQLDQTARLNEVIKQIARVKTGAIWNQIIDWEKGAILIMNVINVKTLVECKRNLDKMDKTITVEEKLNKLPSLW